jgi:hypothetical protein
MTVKTKVKRALINGIKSILELTESLPGKNFVIDLNCKVRRNILIPGTTMFDMMEEIKSFAANAIIIADAKPTTLLSFINFLKST